MPVMVFPAHVYSKNDVAEDEAIRQVRQESPLVLERPSSPVLASGTEPE